MTNHIKNIDIKNFKCFKDFKVERLARVNLITGQNNVGKTALMEACYLLFNAFKIFKENDYKENTGADRNLDRNLFHFEIIKLLLAIQLNREKNIFYSQWITEEFKFNLDDFAITIDDKFRLLLNDNVLTPEHFGIQEWGNWNSSNINDFRKSQYYEKIYTKNHLPVLDNHTFISICDHGLKTNDLIGDLKINNTIKKLNIELNKLFNVSEIDVIKNKIMLKKTNEKFTHLSNFGDGTKHFINMIVSLLSSENNTVYLDEIDNGIHYDKLDDLWEIILTLSKEKNVQIFATTHSEECLKSYAKVAERLADKDIALIELGKKEGKLQNIVFDYERTIREISKGFDVRGWNT